MREIPIHSRKYPGLFALVDDADYELVNAYRWFVRWSTSRNRRVPYATARIPGDSKHMISMHRLVTGNPQTDHKNGNGLDNQRHNLRPATDAENMRNRRKLAGTSHLKGVYWDRRRSKWHAAISVGKSRYFLGYHDDEEEAGRPYDAAAAKHFGEFAWLNFPKAA